MQGYRQRNGSGRNFWRSWQMKDLEIMERLRIDQTSSGHRVDNRHINMWEITIYLVSIVITYLLFATHGVYTWPF